MYTHNTLIHINAKSPKTRTHTNAHTRVHSHMYTHVNLFPFLQDDICILTENDNRYWMGMEKTASDRFLIVGVESKETSENHIIDLKDVEGLYYAILYDLLSHDDFFHYLFSIYISFHSFHFISFFVLFAFFHLFRYDISTSYPTRWCCS